MSARHGNAILLVEDCAHIRIAAAGLLRDEGFEVIDASNGRVALDYLLAAVTTPGLILLDLNMPVMSGWEMIKALGDDLRLAKIPIVLMTAQHVSQGLTNGMVVERLLKPFAPEELIATVRRHCPSDPQKSRPSGVEH